MVAIDTIATGNRIRELRDKRGLSNKDLMDAVGFNNPTAIFKWFRGDNLPTIDNMVILADLFGVTIDEIIVRKTIDVITVA